MSFTEQNIEKINIYGEKSNQQLKPIREEKEALLNLQERDVYPQYSEPDEYSSVIFWSPISNSTLSKCEELGKSISNERFNTLHVSDSKISKNGQHEASSSKLPTFRQLLKDDATKKHHSKEMKIRNRNSLVSKGSFNESDHGIYKKYQPKLNENFCHQESKSYEMNKILQKSEMALIGTRTRHIFGTVDQITRWHKMTKNTEYELYYEVAGILESKIKKDRKHLLFIRSESGHMLQGVFYSIDRELIDFQPGTTITATGHMIGSNKLHIFDAAEIKADDNILIQRLAFLSQRSLQEALYGLNLK